MKLMPELPPETEAIVKQRVAQTGQTVDADVEKLIERSATTCSGADLVAALDAAPKVPSEWVDELERLIEEGRRPPSRTVPFDDPLHDERKKQAVAKVAASNAVSHAEEP